MAAPNILNATSIIGMSTTLVATASTQNILTCPANKLIKITSMFCTNSHTALGNLDVRLNKNGLHCERSFFGMSDDHGATSNNMTFPASRTQVYPAGWYMEENDVLAISCDTESVKNQYGGLTVCVSYDLIDDA